MRTSTYIRGARNGKPVFFLSTDGGCAWVDYKYASAYTNKIDAETDMERWALTWDASVTDIKTETH